MGFWDDWMHSRKLKQAEQKAELQRIAQQGQQAALTTQQYAMQTRDEANRQQLELAEKVAALRYKINNDNIDIEQRLVVLAKEKDELEQSKGKFRLYLDGERQELDLKREQFNREQDRADKSLDNEQTYKMGELHLRKLELEQNYFFKMAELDLKREEQQYQRIQAEAVKSERLLAAMRTEQAQEQDYRYKEREQAMALDAKQFEYELKKISLLDASMQAQAHKDLQQKMDERMNRSNGSGDRFGGY